MLASDSDGVLPDLKPAYVEGSQKELAGDACGEPVGCDLQPVVEVLKAEDVTKVAE